MSQDRETYRIGAKIAEAESYSGFFHIDFMRDSQTGELFVLEFNPRVWSSINASALNGHDFIAAAVAVATGSDVPMSEKSYFPYSKFRRSFSLLLQKPFSLAAESSVSRTDFVRVLTDPVPYFLLAITEGAKRAKEKFSRFRKLRSRT